MYGLAAIGGWLFEGAPDGPAEGITAEVVEWITEHEPDLGLAAGLDDGDVGLVPAAGFIEPLGGLTIVRFTQTYRGRPVLPPDDLVQLVYTEAGAIQISGQIVDGRTDYADHEASASARRARESMRFHAHVRAQVPLDEVTVDEPTLVAMPQTQQVAWLGYARRRGGGTLARVIVSADASTPPGGPLPLVSWRPTEAEDLTSTAPIQVRSADPASDPALYATSVETTRVDGGALLGSIEDVGGEVQLANDAVVVLNLNGGSQDDLDVVGSRITDAGGDFLAMSGPAFSGQFTYHLLQSWYARMDGLMTDPASGTKRWDSAIPAYQPGDQSPTPAGIYAPRVVAFVNTASGDCGSLGIACADREGYATEHKDALVFPELVHRPSGTDDGYEAVGRISIPTPGPNGDDVDTLAHELGHIVDLFAGSGITAFIAPDCGGACTFECVEDTSDEAPALSETLAQLVGMLLLQGSFEPIDFEYCGIVQTFSRNGTKPWDPGPCVPPGEDLSMFQRPETCMGWADYCDKPAQPGFGYECCDPAVDLGCLVQAPGDCPDTGFQRQVPTGLCHTSPGYDTHSALQAFWQLLHGQRCEPIAPFACESASWPPGVDPADAVGSALLYSMRLNPLSYAQLFDGMATYITCTYGDDVYGEYNAVMCAHGLRDCDEPAPVVCQTCGNGVREGTETCDDLDWAVATCSDLDTYVGGDLQCDAATCELDDSLCTEPGDDGLDSTAGTGGGVGMETTGFTATETDDGSTGASGDGGCTCHTATEGRAWTWVLMLLACLGLRHRRSVQ